VAARLGSIAEPGEVLASREIWTAAGRDRGGEKRRVEIAGRHSPIEVVVVRPSELGPGG
jgi:class 3 adenylate cyclase